INLTAGDHIGLNSDLLQIDSSNPTNGVLTASAPNSIFINEVAGDLRVNTVKSTNPSDTTTTHDVMLSTQSWSILDARLHPTTDLSDVSAINIDLVALGGGIGQAGTGADDHSKDFLIDSSTAGVASGRLYATASDSSSAHNDSVHITEVSGELNV